MERKEYRNCTRKYTTQSYEVNDLNKMCAIVQYINQVVNKYGFTQTMAVTTMLLKAYEEPVSLVYDVIYAIIRLHFYIIFGKNYRLMKAWIKTLVL
jgi:hypothetical protein